MKLSKTTIAFIFLFVIILILLAIIIFRKPDKIIEPYDDSAQVQRILELESINDSLTVLADQQLSGRDTIVVYKDSIKTIYREKYVYINDASPIQLDSIIRAGLD